MQISNTLIIAKKEFSNLLNNKLMLIVMLWFFIVLVSVMYAIAYPFDGYPPMIFNEKDPVNLFFVMFTNMFCYYGSILAVALGFISMSEETSGKAMNTLLVKPVYRDTVINGKLLGIFGFYVSLFIFILTIYILAMSSNPVLVV